MVAAAESSAARMNGIYRYQRHFYDASRACYLLGRNRLIDELNADSSGCRILEVACGTGRNLIRTARRYPNSQVFGFDISSAMLATARRSVVRNHLGSRVRLAQGDATDFDTQALFGVPAVDRILVSYALSMIPRWQTVIERSAAALAPGGALHVVDFGDFNGYPEGLRRFQRSWLAHFSVTPVNKLEEGLAGLAGRLGLSYSSQHLFPRLRSSGVPSGRGL